ncbi:histidine kinase [Pseudomonas sp. RIT-PI-q]|uniref:PAS domain-containing sensor histidine kinase n=1 Tax=Pseudomonas sp. RIT-PI-q TaxID=1690247 RepID=UPI0006CC97D8|nr:ATP-binding protein [Pseudomonas sp. RIT-PI-q]KPG95971.1 histidine kinase [Pseudomonas sp. RIT-PI-q]
MNSSISSAALRVGICVSTLSIFIIDTLTSLNMAVAVLYVLVILIAMNSFCAYGLCMVSLACAGLTLAAYFISHCDELLTSALARCLVSLIAIAITAWLAAKSQKANDRLQEQLRLLAHTHDAIMVCSMDSTIRTWNVGAQNLYGWTKEEAIGKKCWELLKSQSSISIMEIRAELLREGSWEGELTQSTRNGKTVIISTRWLLSRDGHGFPRSILASNNDITDARIAEEALHRSQVTLAHISRVTTVGELMASIAHEVNQPLTAIATNAEAARRWLGRSSPDLDEARAAIERTASDAKRASEIIQRIRAMTRKTEPKYESLDLGRVMAETLTLLDREIQQHKIKVFCHLGHRRSPVLGDQIQLQQVLINLIMNSIQAISLSTNSLRNLYLTIREEAGQSIVEVRDSGEGVDAGHLDVLFEAFFTTKVDGMGMGLSICRSIIESHSGRIWAKSNAGEGAVFSFSLPCALELIK